MKIYYKRKSNWKSHHNDISAVIASTVKALLVNNFVNTNCSPSVFGGRRRKGSRRYCKARKRVRRSVQEIYEALGPIYFRRAYRMSYESFWKLHDKILPYLIKASGYQSFDKVGSIPNGRIPYSVRLACAIRYFAGGSVYDIECKYGVGHTDVYNSVWNVVDAVNMLQDFELSYPDDIEKQKKIAQDFKNISDAGIDCCAGAVDGILIWIQRPSKKECEKNGCDPMKFMCGRKGKFGLNCQAVADARGRFLEMSIVFPGSTSDCLAFEGSSLYKRLEDGLLLQGLCLFGDNAYINSHFMATPFSGRTSQWNDSYNFHHSQLRIRVECAFGIFLQRWGILRSAIANRVTISKTIALVMALAKLHNFCIDEESKDVSSPVPQMNRGGTTTSLSPSLRNDENNIAYRNGMAAVPLVEVEEGSQEVTPRVLLDGGNHFDDVDRNSRRRVERQLRQDNQVLPRERMRDEIAEAGFVRPIPIPRRH